MRKRLCLCVGFCALAIVFSPILAAEPARKSVRLLIVTGGIPSTARALRGFKSLEGSTSERPSTARIRPRQANLELAPQKAKDFDVLLLYDLHQQITEEAKKDFVALLDGGRASSCSTTPWQTTRAGRSFGGSWEGGSA